MWLTDQGLSQAAPLPAQLCSLTYFSGQMAVFLRKILFLLATDHAEGIGRHCF